MKILISAIIFISSVYFGIVLLVYLFQSKLIFFPMPVSSSPSELQRLQANEITVSNGTINLHGWLLNPGQEKIILYFGGNAEEVSSNIIDFKKYSDYSVVLMNYRGYGNSEGTPGQDNLFADAIFIYDHFLRQPESTFKQIVLWGRSLGSGVAIYLASRRKVDKIILVTPYDSLIEIASRHYPFLPARLLLKHPFESIKYVKKIEATALILYAEHDKIIPYASTDRLIQQFGSNCQAINILQTDHNTIQLSGQYWQSISAFLK